MNRVLYGDMAALVIAAGVLTYVTILFVRFTTRGIKVFDAMENKMRPETTTSNIPNEINSNSSSEVDEQTE